MPSAPASGHPHSIFTLPAAVELCPKEKAGRNGEQPIKKRSLGEGRMDDILSDGGRAGHADIIVVGTADTFAEDETEVQRRLRVAFVPDAAGALNALWHRLADTSLDRPIVVLLDQRRTPTAREYEAFLAGFARVRDHQRYYLIVLVDRGNPSLLFGYGDLVQPI
jgi:hypothetical protein